MVVGGAEKIDAGRKRTRIESVVNFFAYIGESSLVGDLSEQIEDGELDGAGMIGQLEMIVCFGVEGIGKDGKDEG